MLPTEARVGHLATICARYLHAYMLDVFPTLAIAPGGKGREEIAIGACVRQKHLCVGANVCSSTATVLAPSKCQGTRFQTGPGSGRPWRIATTSIVYDTGYNSESCRSPFQGNLNIRI